MAQSVDADTFRHAMAQLAAPLTVLTCYGPGGEPVGLTVNAVSSLSVRPPLVLVCLNRTNQSHDTVVSAARLCLHILGPGQEHLAFRFASRVDRFAGQHVRHGDAPELLDVQVRLTLTPEGTREGGDHTIYLGRVVDVTAPADGGGGLVWHQRGAVHAAPPPSAAAA